jgi:hypothetical protein
MKTPITDKLAGQAANFVRNAQVLHASHARRLELDRAALMEALDRIEKLSIDGWASSVAEDALTNARANFPNA